MKKAVLTGFLACLLVLLASNPGVASSTYRWPVDTPTHVTSSFGEYRGDHLHNGIDFSTGGRPGRNVYAIESGWVIKAFYDSSAYGKTLVLQHPNGQRSWYSHLRSFSDTIKSQLNGPLNSSDVRELNITVRRGDLIAKSGHTGRGPSHLHLTLQAKNGEFINPLGHFTPRLPFNPRPTIRTLRFFPLTGKTWINGQSRSVRLRPPVDKRLELWGDVGLDLLAFNKHEKDGIRSVPEHVKIYRNGSKVFERSFERLTAYDQDTGTYLIYDEVSSNLGPTNFMLHATPQNRQRRWTGFSFDNSGETGTLRVEVETARGRFDRYTLPYRIVPPPRSVAWSARGSDNPTTVTRHQTESATFKLVSLSNRQRAAKQYSPPINTEPGTPEIDLDYEWKFNRIKFDISINDSWSGWPELTIQQEGFDTSPSLIQVEPGHFRTWWTPGRKRDGWHLVTLTLENNGETLKRTDRLYIQAFRPGELGSAISLDGRFSLFSSGMGLQVPAAVQFEKLEKPPPTSELTYVGSPRRIAPDVLNTTYPMELTADLSDGIEHPDSVGLYRWNPVTDEWEVLSFRSDITRYSRIAEIYSGQVIALLQDRKAPRLSKPEWSSSGKYLRFSVEENGSGVLKGNIEVTVAGEPIPFRWDTFYQSVYVHKSNLRSGQGTLRIRMADRAGNVTHWNGQFDG